MTLEFQVVPDARYSSEEPGQFSSERLEEWRRDLTAFLDHAATIDRAENQKKVNTAKKIQRLDSFWSIICWNHQLLTLTGEGMNRFKGRDAEARPLHLRDHASFVLDAASNNCTPASFLQYFLDLNVSFFWGPLHRLWSSCWGATRTAGLYSCVLVCGCMTAKER